MTISLSTKGDMADIDLASDDFVHVGIDAGRGLRLERPCEVVRVRAVDLRALANRVRWARQERPRVPVLVDIYVMIATDSSLARAAMAETAAPIGDTLLYVGTPTGLAGLVTDIHALGLADGAVFLPLNGAAGVAQIREQVLPSLRSMVTDDRDGAQSA